MLQLFAIHGFIVICQLKNSFLSCKKTIQFFFFFETFTPLPSCISKLVNLNSLKRQVVEVQNTSTANQCFKTFPKADYNLFQTSSFCLRIPTSLYTIKLILVIVIAKCQLFNCIKNLKSLLYIAYFSRYWSLCFCPKLHTDRLRKIQYSTYKFIFGLF